MAHIHTKRAVRIGRTDRVGESPDGGCARGTPLSMVCGTRWGRTGWQWLEKVLTSALWSCHPAGCKGMQWFTQPCGGGKGAQCCLRCVVEPYIGLGDAACLQQLVKVARQLPRREAKRR